MMFKVVEGSVNNNMTCDLGNELCFKLNSTLTSIHSDAENFFVLGLTLSKNRNANMYTAIGIISDGYTFKWRDGTPVDYSYWNSNVLRADTCAVMFTSLDYSYISQWVGGWNHNQMSSSFNKAVCKMSAYGNA
uniref:C-type lectin domain-containing protein n=1 Tax=Panagrolaimus sp. ES5 TaxID=591445 RepID=A0AC34GJU1_9BILA